MNFPQSVEYLLSLGNEVTTMKLGLENIRTLLEALGRPQDKYLKVQVAGTNGKGSVCAFLNSICVTAGIRTGMFTSPHLVSVTERVQINGVEIGEDEFARIATIVRETSEQLAADGKIEYIPTFFEQVTAIALVAFAEANVELAILETGLGGRLDATTAANAEIAAITRIDYDHQRYLGETIEEIAAEKAAIIRDEFQQVVIGEQKPQALRVILERCQQAGIRDLEWEPHLRWTVHSAGSGQVKVATHRYAFPPIMLGLLGAHQRENAETAINIVRELRYDYGFSIDDEDVIKGLTTAHHPGRLERIGRVLLDGAHNVGGATALREYLDDSVQQPITMIFGAMNDKNIAEIASILFPRANRVILTQPTNSRAMPVEAMLEFVPERIDRGQVLVARNIREALERADGVSSLDDMIVVTGSLYLVGEARRLIKSQI